MAFKMDVNNVNMRSLFHWEDFSPNHHFSLAKTAPAPYKADLAGTQPVSTEGV